MKNPDQSHHLWERTTRFHRLTPWTISTLLARCFWRKFRLLSMISYRKTKTVYSMTYSLKPNTSSKESKVRPSLRMEPFQMLWVYLRFPSISPILLPKRGKKLRSLGTSIPAAKNSKIISHPKQKETFKRAIVQWEYLQLATRRRGKRNFILWAMSVLMGPWVMVKGIHKSVLSLLINNP